MSDRNGINTQFRRSRLPEGLIIDGRSLGRPAPTMRSVKAAGGRILAPRRSGWLRRLLGYAILVALGAGLLAFSCAAAYGYFFPKEEAVTPTGVPGGLDGPAPTAGRLGDPQEDALLDGLRQAVAQRHRFVAERGVTADAEKRKTRSEWEQRRAVRHGSRLGEGLW